MKTWFLTGLLIVLMTALATTNVFAQGHGFSDVPNNHPAATEIAFLAEEGVVNGYPDGTFRPDAPILRGQVALIMARSLGLIELDGTIITDTVGPGFDDVAETSLFYPALVTLQGAGIVNGYPDGTFRPNENVTRGEIANILAGAYNIERTSTELTFTDQHPAFNDAVQALLDQGISNGTSETTFGTRDTLTRSHFAIFTFRAMALHDDEPGLVESIVFNEDGDQFDINFTSLPDGATVANLDQDEIVALLGALDLADTLLIELNDADVTTTVLPLLDLSTGDDPPP